MTLRELRELPNEEILLILNQMKDGRGELPQEFRSFYQILETARIKALPYEERLALFRENKKQWCSNYPDFENIARIMGNFHSDPMLVEYLHSAPPPSVRIQAVSLFKKCISFREKFLKKIEKILIFGPDVPTIHYPRVNYCIDRNTVANFLRAYQTWNQLAVETWHDIYYLNQDFFFNAGYRFDWAFVTENSLVLKQKAREVEDLYENILAMLQAGRELIAYHDLAITAEYEKSPLDTSLYERELEIALLHELDDSRDEEYCYVYTLECEFFVFYVGISGDPSSRVEQHIRGAFSDESHLFKSTLIKKFQSSMKWKIVFEGTRGECKAFERGYIEINKPLGNMTVGGEG